MDRKEFLHTGLIFSAGALSTGFTDPKSAKGGDPLPDFLVDIPIYCSHEHWGSLFHIGSGEDGFMADMKPGALPSRRTTLLDLLFDPYLTGNLVANGIHPLQYGNQQDPVNLTEEVLSNPEEAFRLLPDILKDIRLKGTYQVMQLGIRIAHDFELQSDDLNLFTQANDRVAGRYAHMFSWYRQLMAIAGLSNLMRPVQPEFYFADFGRESAREEMAFTSTLLRIDPFLDFWKEKHPRRERLVEELGVDPMNASSWRNFLEKLLERASDLGCLGIKQLQAYMRNLDFVPVNDSEVTFRGVLSGYEIKRFQDWVLHTFCDLAHQRKWPHQIHVGTHNHPDSNPLPLKRLAEMYPDQNIVMLHCWPYLEESAFLAQAYPNVYVDTCWQPILNPDFLRRSMETWLGYIPLNKWTMSNDSTSVEMAAGASLITRSILGKALLSQQSNAGLSDRELREIATRFLHNNAVQIYKSGTNFQS